MSSSQRQPRRLSARIQEKAPENVQHQSSKPRLEAQRSTDHGKKRKNGETLSTCDESVQLTVLLAYDEENDGFTFTRVKKNKQKDTRPNDPPQPQQKAPVQPNPAKLETFNKDGAPTDDGAAKPTKKKPPKMSFSTPKPLPQDEQQLRRSKRLSSEHDDWGASPNPKTRRNDANPPRPTDVQPKDRLPHREKSVPSEPAAEAGNEHVEPSRDPAATKIALPFADTPVIKRNKAMREGKSGKGERRSSLSLRGRRASSLIETGNSNALPHSEVEIADFYNHIESDGLPEPRRMRQLLTWCATRCLTQKSRGAEFEDSSAVAAARVIEEELLKDLSNRSELSDWFSREDILQLPKELPIRPNPKNLQNAEKIKELEEQIQRYVSVKLTVF